MSAENRIELGTTVEKIGGGKPALMDVRELLQTRLLIQGNSGSGKSYLLRRLLEQSAPLVQQVIIDPEGDFGTLAEKFSHVVIDANRSEADLVLIAQRVREKRVSCVLDLNNLEVDMQMTAAALFLNAMFDMPEKYWAPMIVAVDEAQMFAPSAAGDVSEAARRTSLGAMTNLMCRGRKRGLCGIIATQRLAKLAKNVAAEASNFLMGRTFLDIDMERAADLLGLSTKQAEMFRDLNQGNFIGLGPALSRVPLSIRVGQVVTRARSGTPNMAPPPEKLDEDALGELLAPAPGATRAHVVRRPAPVKSDTETLIANVDSTERLQAADESVPDKPQQTDEDRAAMKRTYRDIVVGVMSTPDSDFAQEAALYQEFNVTCRLKGVPRIDLSAFRRLVPAARVGIDGATSEDPDWSRVLATADDLPPDRQAVYLLLARAAKAGDPCPSDIEFARKCGSASPGRGRARVEGLEKDAFITVKKDMRGKRVVSLPDFGWETAPGDQNGAA